MNGHVEVNTGDMLSVAQRTAGSMQNIQGHARTLKSGLDYVITAWQGQTADGFRTNMQNQSAMLDQLIQKLDQVGQLIKSGGQGFDSTDVTGGQRTASAGQGFLSAPVNR